MILLMLHASGISVANIVEDVVPNEYKIKPLYLKSTYWNWVYGLVFIFLHWVD